MKLADNLRAAIESLKNAGIDNPQLDTRLLFCHALNIDRAQLLSQSERILTAPEIAAIDTLITRRAKRESVARIIGQREFWGLDFGLNEATLEPRPDSETLVEAILELGLRGTGDGGWQNSAPRILDLGTGTGCLLLALLHELPNANGIGIDISPRAVEQATQNAAALGLDARATFRTGNWLQGVTEKFDIIIGNPPYIPASDISALMPEVRDFDPARALDSGADGLASYHATIPQLSHFLNPQGIAAFECGHGQAQAVADLFRTNGFAHIETYKDLSGTERCILATLV